MRRVLDEAGRGTPFDEMAVFLRTPQQYLGLLEHACARGGVPVYFDRGTRRPNPAGRAFVALLSCAVDGLSAKRFDEYLSLGQVPQFTGKAAAPAVITPLDEVFAVEADRNGAPASSDPWTDAPDGAVDPTIDSDEEAIVAGTLRSPWKWEELIVESAVVGGRTREEGKARWRRRLDGLAADFSYRIEELKKDEPESARIARFERDRRNLAHLRQFALPIVDALAEWPEQATWGEWLAHFSALATRSLRRPARVLQTLADLRPMADVGPVALEEARDVLHDRLVTLDWRAAGAALRARVRRHTASGARSIVPRRVRAGPCRARRPAAAARGPAAARRGAPCDRSGAHRPGRAGPRRAAAVEARHRRRGRAPLPLVSAAGRQRDAGPGAVVLRARRGTGDHRPRSGPPCAGVRGGRRRRREPLVAGAEGSGSRDRRPRTRSGDPEAAARGARSVDGQGARALPARAERVAAALGDQPLGARTRRLVSQRRPDPRRTRHARRRSRRNVWAAAPTRCRLCSGLRPARTSFCSRRSIASSRGTSPSRWCAWIR